jgi:hypothetical protein
VPQLASVSPSDLGSVASNESSRRNSSVVPILAPEYNEVKDNSCENTHTLSQLTEEDIQVENEVSDDDKMYHEKDNIHLTSQLTEGDIQVENKLSEDDKIYHEKDSFCSTVKSVFLENLRKTDIGINFVYNMVKRLALGQEYLDQILVSCVSSKYVDLEISRR